MWSKIVHLMRLKHMLSLLSVASAEICWQLYVDMAMAALLEAGCLFPWLSVSIKNRSHARFHFVEGSFFFLFKARPSRILKSI